ncbi:MAG: hypothetical protein ACKV2U_16640 [Bryobacteraceae bacterium]
MNDRIAAGIPRSYAGLDLPDVVALRAARLLLLSLCKRDRLFLLAGMEESVAIYYRFAGEGVWVAGLGVGRVSGEILGEMTIHIPDDLARDLERIAAPQKQSVEQLAVERLRAIIDRSTSPEVLLQTIRALPHPSAAAVDELDAAIASARLPVVNRGEFDGHVAE